MEHGDGGGASFSCHATRLKATYAMCNVEQGLQLTGTAQHDLSASKPDDPVGKLLSSLQERAALVSMRTLDD